MGAGKSHIFSDPPNFCDPMIAIYRQCKMRERNCSDISTKVENDQILVELKGDRKISFVYCPLVDRIFTKSNFDLDKVNYNDGGVTGRPNMFGEMEELGEIGKQFTNWIKNGWKCYR